MTQTTFTDNVLVDGSQDIKQLRVQGHTTQLQPIQTWEDSAGGTLAQVTSEGRLEILANDDVEELRVQGHTTQTQPLQTWRDSAGDVLAQVTGDGRLIVGDDVTPDSLIEAHRLETSTTKPKRGLHSLGQISGALSTLVQWIVGELELRGSTAIDALHTVLRVRLTNFNTAAPESNAELRGGDIEVVHDATAHIDALPKATGLQVTVTNANGKTITDAAALRLKVNNEGTGVISNPYAIFSEGPGITHLENFVELKSQTDDPDKPATDFMRIYPKSDGKLYAKNWIGIDGQEYDLTGSISPWQTDDNVVNLVTPGDVVTIGSDTALAKLGVDGDADEVQFLVEGHSTQTNPLVVFRNSDGNKLFTIAGDHEIAVNTDSLSTGHFVVRSSNDPFNLVSVASTDTIGIGTNAPFTSAKLHVVSIDKGSIPRPVMTATQVAAIASPTEGLRAYESDTEHDTVYDGQRFRSLSVVGWTPHAFPVWNAANADFAQGLNLPANGGSVAVAIHVPSHMLLQSVSIRQVGVSGAKTWGWDLYEQYLNNGNSGENTLARVAASNGTDSFTASAASNRTLDAASAPVYLAPGVYWLVIQNRHASNVFFMGTRASAALVAGGNYQTKTTTNPNGSTLDFVAATWTKSTAFIGVMLNGRVFGQTAEF